MKQDCFLNAAVDAFANLESWVLDLMTLQTLTNLVTLLWEATVYYQCVDSKSVY